MSALATPSAALLRSLATVPLILGSGSASRKQILTDLGLRFSVEKPDIDEKKIRRERPADLVLALGLAKAAALNTGSYLVTTYYNIPLDLYSSTHKA